MLEPTDAVTSDVGGCLHDGVSVLTPVDSSSITWFSASSRSCQSQKIVMRLQPKLSIRQRASQGNSAYLSPGLLVAQRGAQQQRVTLAALALAAAAAALQHLRLGAARALQVLVTDVVAQLGGDLLQRRVLAAGAETGDRCS